MFTLTEEQVLIAETAARFAADQLWPHASAWEAAGTLDRPTLKAAAGLGFAALTVAEDVGGTGLGRLEAALVFEQLSRGCIATATFLSIHNMVSGLIDRQGTPEQRQKFLPALARMDRIASYCLTESEAGSDAASLRTKAVREGDVYVLDGAKMFISGGGFSDLYLVMARTGEAGPKGISAFLVEAGTPGLSFGAPEKKMGWKAQPTTVVTFENCRIPAENRLGAEGQGFKFAMMGLDGGRINIGAAALGGAGQALDLALAYTKERRQFGKAIAAFQASQFKLADMATELEAARLLIYRAAAALDAGDPQATMLAAMAKRFATDTGWKIANDALQLHGGYGYLHDYQVERIVRDLRVHQILEGTNEIMRVIIARAILAD